MTGRVDDAAMRALRADVDAAVGYVTSWPLQLATGTPAEAICREAHYRAAGMIVMGLRHHDTLDRVLREETTLLVVRRGGIPVLAVTPLLADLPRRVVVAVDFSRGSLRAARAACSIVAEGGTLSLVHVQPEVDSRCEELDGLQASYAQGVVGALARLASELRVPAGVTVDTVVLRGAPAGALLDFSERADAELIAVGSQGHEITQRPGPGSVTTGLVRDGRCSLLVTPPFPPDRPRADGTRPL